MEKEKQHTGKPVSLFELFYDLVFVYAIANLTKVLAHAENGSISFFQGLLYFVIAIQVLEIWLYQTNYNNRFGSGKWYEVILMSVNMMAMLLLSNIMGVITLNTIRVSLIIPAVVFMTVGIPYYIIARKEQNGAPEAKSFSRMIFSFTGICLASLLLSFLELPITVFYVLSTLTVAAAAVVPVFIRRDFDTSIVDFPHLTERFELLTIISFGEMVTSAARYYAIDTFDHISVGAFVVILLLFGSYVIHNHHLINRKAESRGLVLMFSHFGIILGINLMTVGQTLILEHEENTNLVGALMIIGTLLFYLCMYMNGVYYDRKLWEKSEVLAGIALLVAAAAVMAIFRDGRVYLGAMFVLSLIDFAALLRKKAMEDRGKAGKNMKKRRKHS